MNIKKFTSKLIQRSIEIITFIASLSFATVSYYNNSDLGAWGASLGLLLITILTWKFTTISNRLKRFETGVEIRDNQNLAFHELSTNIRNAQDRILAFGPGLAGRSSLLKKYLRSVISFMDKNQKHLYTRILLISEQAPEVAYTWLLFLYILKSKYKERVNIHIALQKQQPAITTPFTIIDDSFVHLVYGVFTEEFQTQLANQVTLLFTAPQHIRYFNNVFADQLRRKSFSSEVKLDQLNDEMERYKALLKIAFKQKAMEVETSTKPNEGSLQDESEYANNHINDINVFISSVFQAPANNHN